MSFVVEDNDVDIVIAALWPDLTALFEGWRPIFSRFHIIIIKDYDLEADLHIPPGFDHHIYTKSDIERVVGSTSINFSGHSCRYFGYLISSKKYVVSIDADCLPARDDEGRPIDAISQHIINLKTPATPFFFNTLYDPFREGTDFVRGYPFSLRTGVECVLSCGLWLNAADFDVPTQAVKPHEKNTRYVDAVLTVPLRTFMPVSGINIGFNRHVLGPVMLPAMRLDGEGKQRWGTMDDIWCGMCAKVVCDHLGLGAKTGMPYVWRVGGGNAWESLKKEWKGVKLMEEIVPFFQSVKLPRTVATAEDCVIQIAAMVRGRLGPVDEVFSRAADAMEEWLRIWKRVGSQGR
ncbi:putative UDP-arabinopyranose mutase 2 [Apostasia shenzhenica]|uniref:Putative UDP-arabinopyranose mutase 2 n=1 Tax=Apostasia shenzhenica TaxID=1088818 RepID=A0A2H9ZZ87_9ASPA|nr:putative UDP-arabinopyranose mutase 2 [Apostasia shenzhenica]